MGLRGDMRIETTSGPVSVSELARRCETSQGLSVSVFVWTGTRFYVAKALDFRAIGQEQIFIVELDSGDRLYVSASSSFVMLNRTTKLPPELVDGDSLLPLYTSEDAHGYPTYKEPGTTQPYKFSRLVAEWKTGQKLPPGTFVEHIDKNRKNYHPDNLQITQNIAKASKSRSYGIIQAVEDAQALFDEYDQLGSSSASIILKPNHRVLSVEVGHLEDVFTATIDTADTVAVSGVFLKI